MQLGDLSVCFYSLVAVDSARIRIQMITALGLVRLTEPPPGDLYPGDPGPARPSPTDRQPSDRSARCRDFEPAARRVLSNRTVAIPAIGLTPRRSPDRRSSGERLLPGVAGGQRSKASNCEGSVGRGEQALAPWTACSEGIEPAPGFA